MADTGTFGWTFDVLLEVTDWIHIIGQAVTLFAVGCRLLPRNFEYLEKGLCTGMFLQSLILPPLGCLIAYWFQLSPADALSLLATSAAPVATYVSVLTHWGRGNVALSILLTAMSTTLSIGLFPLWFFTYSSIWTRTVVVIAHPIDVSFYLVLVIIPMGCGMFVRRLFPSVAKKLAKVLSFAFMVEILMSTVIVAVVRPSQFDAEFKIWKATFVLPIIAYVLGFLSAYLLSLSFEKCVAVSMAIGISNSNMITATVRRLVEHPEQILKVPEFYGVFAPIQGLVWAMLYKKCHALVHEKYPKIFSTKEYDDALEE